MSAENTVLTVASSVSAITVAAALASHGLTIRDGRIEPAALTREEALRMNRRNARDTMHFTPHDGLCWSCNGDLVEQYGIPAIAAGMNVTGCRRCFRSFCD